MERVEETPESGDPVVVTRPAPDAAPFAEALRRRGMRPILSPVMRIEYKQAPPSLEGVSAIAFTSANGVRAMAPAAGMAAGWPVYAVGDMTAAAARAAGYRAVESAAGDLKSLVELILARHDGAGAVLHPAGRDRAGDLVAALTARGLNAQRAILYEAVPIETLTAEAVMALTSGPSTWVAFFSPRSARLFLDQVARARLTDEVRRARAACLSQSVAMAAGAAAWSDLRVAQRATADGLIRVMRGD